MFNKILFPSLFFINMFFIHTTYAQCTDFVVSEGFSTLDTSQYIPEGRFDVMVLSQGDYLKVYKSFFRGKTYRIAVCGDDNLGKLNFKIKSMQGEVIYDNKNSGLKKIWDYTSDKNQNLIIRVELPHSGGSIPKSGCVAVILGYKI